MKTKLFIPLCVALPIAAAAQIDYSGGIYTQDFNTLESGVIFSNYTTIPAGWYVSKGSYVWTSVTNGYSNNYGTYCFSLAPGDPDKAIGLVIGSTGPAYLGARFRNTSGAALNSFTLSYFAEQWAKGAITSNDQVIPFEYSLNATSLTSGIFTNVAALDMHSINDGNGSGGALDGHAASNRQFIAATVAGVSWLPNQDLWIRWRGVSSYGFFSAHAMAVDDLSFRAVPELQISSSSPGQFLISWSTNYDGYTLESALNSTPATWVAVTNDPVRTDTGFGVTLNPPEAQRLFRLKMQ